LSLPQSRDKHIAENSLSVSQTMNAFTTLLEKWSPCKTMRGCKDMHRNVNRKMH